MTAASKTFRRQRLERTKERNRSSKANISGSFLLVRKCTKEEKYRKNAHNDQKLALIMKLCEVFQWYRRYQTHGRFLGLSSFRSKWSTMNIPKLSLFCELQINLQVLLTTKPFGTEITTARLLKWIFKLHTVLKG
jgi:hypothetical protein